MRHAWAHGTESTLKAYKNSGPSGDPRKVTSAEGLGWSPGDLCQMGYTCAVRSHRPARTGHTCVALPCAPLGNISCMACGGCHVHYHALMARGFPPKLKIKFVSLNHLGGHALLTEGCVRACHHGLSQVGALPGSGRVIGSLQRLP